MLEHHTQMARNSVLPGLATMLGEIENHDKVDDAFVSSHGIGVMSLGGYLALYFSFPLYLKQKQSTEPTQLVALILAERQAKLTRSSVSDKSASPASESVNQLPEMRSITQPPKVMINSQSTPTPQLADTFIASSEQVLRTGLMPQHPISFSLLSENARCTKSLVGAFIKTASFGTDLRAYSALIRAAAQTESPNWQAITSPVTIIAGEEDE